MLDVNIWLPTTVVFNKYRIKHGIFGPLLASESKGEHVGHANFVVKIDERSENYASVDTDYNDLEPRKTLDNIPSSSKMPKHFSPMLSNQVRCNQFTNSFWPAKKPTFFSIMFKDPLKKAGLYSGRAGVKATFETHDSDMLAEDYQHTENTATSIEHKQSLVALIKQIEKEQNENINFIMGVGELETNLDDLEQLQQQLQQLELDHADFTAQYTQLTLSHKNQMREFEQAKKNNTQSIEKVNKQLSILGKIHTYLVQAPTLDKATQKQLTAITEDIATLQTEQQRLFKAKNESLLFSKEVKLRDTQELEQLENALTQSQKQREQLTVAIKKMELALGGKSRKDVADLTVEGRRRKEFIRRKEQFLKERDFTEGKQPEHVITLPTKADGSPYFLDEIKILEAMRKERTTKYSFVFHNCAASVKSCLLAGISEPLKKKLREAGLKSSFFTVDTIETCQSLKRWTCTLQSTLLKLNAQMTEEHQPKENISIICTV